MQITPLIHNGEGFSITTEPCIDFHNEYLGIHLHLSNQSYQLTLSTGAIGNIDAQLHIYFTADHRQWVNLIEPFLNEKLIPDNRAVVMERYWNCTPTMVAMIVTILKCNLTTDIRGLYYEAKALELLSLTIDRIVTAEVSLNLLKFSQDDIEMLENARDILISDFENIPTIKQLARKVGTNDFKLKKGFKQHFGSSIFAYVQDVRLRNARQLLIETNHSITDIAYMTGYDHSNNFSVAFKKKFGVGVRAFKDFMSEGCY